MTITRETAEVLHPPWCDLTTCDPNPEDEGARHRSAGTMWPVQTDEVQVTVAMVRDDDIVRGDQAAPTQMMLSMLNTASMHLDGCSLYADAYITPDDARMLARVLTRYADLTERAWRFDEHGFQESDLARRG